MYPVDIEAGRSHMFWITLKTDPAKSKPGKYTGTITIKSDQENATLPIEVEVLPFKLVALDRAVADSTAAATRPCCPSTRCANSSNTTSTS